MVLAPRPRVTENEAGAQRLTTLETMVNGTNWQLAKYRPLLLLQARRLRQDKRLLVRFLSAFRKLKFDEVWLREPERRLEFAAGEEITEFKCWLGGRGSISSLTIGGSLYKPEESTRMRSPGLRFLDAIVRT
jgi:hypothetical protein